MAETVLIAVLSLFASIAVVLYRFGRTNKPRPKMQFLMSLLRKVCHQAQERRARWTITLNRTLL